MTQNVTQLPGMGQVLIEICNVVGVGEFKMRCGRRSYFTELGILLRVQLSDGPLWPLPVVTTGSS